MDRAFTDTHRNRDGEIDFGLCLWRIQTCRCVRRGCKVTRVVRVGLYRHLVMQPSLRLSPRQPRPIRERDTRRTRSYICL